MEPPLAHRAGGIRQAARDPHPGDRGAAILQRPEPVPPQLRGGHSGGSLGRAAGEDVRPHSLARGGAQPADQCGDRLRTGCPGGRGRGPDGAGGAAPPSQPAGGRERDRPRGHGGEPVCRDEVTGRVRDPGRDHPTRRAPGRGVRDHGPRGDAPPGFADPAVCGAGLLRLLVLTGAGGLAGHDRRVAEERHGDRPPQAVQGQLRRGRAEVPRLPVRSRVRHLRGGAGVPAGGCDRLHPGERLAIADSGLDPAAPGALTTDCSWEDGSGMVQLVEKFVPLRPPVEDRVSMLLAQIPSRLRYRNYFYKLVDPRGQWSVVEQILRMVARGEDHLDQATFLVFPEVSVPFEHKDDFLSIIEKDLRPNSVTIAGFEHITLRQYWQLLAEYEVHNAEAHRQLLESQDRAEVDRPVNWCLVAVKDDHGDLRCFVEAKTHPFFGEEFLDQPRDLYRGQVLYLDRK